MQPNGGSERKMESDSEWGEPIRVLLISLAFVGIVVWLVGCAGSVTYPPTDMGTPLPQGQDDTTTFPDPPEDLDNFPDGPEEIQSFTYMGMPETIQYTIGSPSEYNVAVYVSEEGIPGMPSMLLGFSVCVQWDNTELIEPLTVEWSEWVMSPNGGAGPDLVIGGFYEDGEINMGCIANTELLNTPLDMWYLPETTQMLIQATFRTNEELFSGQDEVIHYTMGDSTLTNSTNNVAVGMPIAGSPQVFTTSAYPITNEWDVTIERTD